MSPYETIGGHEAVVRLVDRFYHHMDHRPDAAGIRALHDDDLTFDRHKLVAFLSGWLGGPPLYWEGHSNDLVRRRHAHLPVDTSAAQAWLGCMDAALREVVEDEPLRRQLFRNFARAAMGARNTPDR
jgi:hemoglobin